MKKRSPSPSAFFNLRLLSALLIILAGVSLAMLGSRASSSASSSSFAKGQQKYQPPTKIVDPTLLPEGFDCSKIREMGIDKQENFRAGLIMIACGEAEGGSGPYLSYLERLWQRLFTPFTYGGADVDLITGTETSPHVTQSGTFSWTNPDNPNQIVVAYNDSRTASANYSGASYSSDGGLTFTRLNPSPFATGHGTNFGDAVVIYHRPSGTWHSIWIATGCGGQGFGDWTSTDGGVTWAVGACVANAPAPDGDRESAWSDMNTSSPFYGRLYVSYNNFANAGPPISIVRSTDNGVTWSAPVNLPLGGAGFVRNAQITGDLMTGDVYIAGMNEMGGGLGNRANMIYRSTDGGATWALTYTGPTFAGPGSGLCSSNSYFASMFGTYWRHMGWGEPAALNHVVHYVYAQLGAGADPGDVYYIRSTDSGVTFSAPLKLNTDATTTAQWQPNISVNPNGSLFAMWYDGRNGTGCTPGVNTPCYQMFGRKSTDNGVTWQADMAFSDVISPLPGQPDGTVQGCFAGDYDYGSAIASKHVSSWVDGRVLIGGSSQQDAFTDRELAGPSPTATPTPTPSATFTPTPTATFTPTPTATATFTPTPTATATPTPAVTTNPATNIASFSATLNGSVNPEGSTTTVYFQYGTTTSYGSTTVSQNFSGSTTQPVSADISGLSPNITYHFRLVGMNGGGTSVGGDMILTTMGGPPIVTTNAATSVTSSSATLNGTVNPNGLPTNVHFDYGATTNYGSSTAIQGFSGSTTQPVSANIPGLSPNTTYHFRLVGTNNGGTSFGYDVTFRFDTNTTGPVIITNPATSVMSSSATLNGTVNPKGLTTSVYFQYGASASYGFTTVAQSYSGSTTQPVSANIPGLGPSTTYHFRLVGMNSGGTSFGSDRTFTTPAAGVPPVITSPATARATVNQLFVYQITATAGATSYTAMPVPAGMTFDGVRGILGGTPMNPGTTQIHLTASNSFGTGMRTLTLTVQSASNPGLTIASGTSITARKGQFFSFEVFTNGASRNARLSATGLPAGLRADAVSGLISGTPTANGSFGVTLTVTDGSVTKTSTLQLVFTSDPAIPVISSPREATLVPGHFFSYRIVDSSQQSGTTFSITGQLPPGLTLNPVTGVISGVYNPHDQNGGPIYFGGQMNSHNGSRNTSSPFDILQQRPCTLLKVATRGVVQSGNNQLLGKVNVAGNVSENVMVRAIGPSLRVNGVPLTGRLQNPMLELDHPYSIGHNDDWRTTVIGGIITSNQVAAIQNSHLVNGSASLLPLVPTNPLESAIIANALAPGNYNAIVRPKSGTSGVVGSVEFYDLGPATLNPHLAAQLANFSTRSLVQTGNNVMRTDFTLGSHAGNGSPVKILLRALGPSLSVQGRLLNPTLRLYNGSGVSIAYNDNWMSAPNRQDIVNSGHAPTNNLESAILMTTLSAGKYTAVVGGQNNTTGIAQLEAYVLP